MPVFYMNFRNIFFWQSSFDFLRYFDRSAFGRIVIIILNYSIWLFLALLSFILIYHQSNIFWQLLISTIIAEAIEKYGKKHALWRRPFFHRHDHTPVGLVERWYNTGSFPSGHTTKSVYFFLFILQYGVFNPVLFLLISSPLLAFRVLIGFHYPIDIVGGIVFGSFIWLLTHGILAPLLFNDIIHAIFNFVPR